MQNHDNPEVPPKKRYEKPELTVYGPIAAVTQSSGKGKSDNGGKGGKT